jgi:hypothetical protein
MKLHVESLDFTIAYVTSMRRSNSPLERVTHTSLYSLVSLTCLVKGNATRSSLKMMIVVLPQTREWSLLLNLAPTRAGQALQLDRDRPLSITVRR